MRSERKKINNYVVVLVKKVLDDAAKVAEEDREEP